MTNSHIQTIKLSTSPGPAHDGSSMMNSEDWTRKMHEIHFLSQQAQALGEEQGEHVLNSRRLEQRINQGKLAYGEILRKSLELRRALETRREHLDRDKADLEKERASAKSKGDQIHAIMAKITSITVDVDVDTGTVKHES